ncbi:hypothetical protein [Muricoccus aerilatus]|uniref:hypothetical protein n=1 Tax=Muricoccus aerilatus TaxID=452982 RepID=UPI000B2C6EFE|nr:hypothetical protein [Roseomonas aerilata]
MTDDPPELPAPETPPSKPARSPAQAAREERLAAALRENLRRRKAQSRERAPRPPAPNKG